MALMLFVPLPQGASTCRCWLPERPIRMYIPCCRLVFFAILLLCRITAARVELQSNGRQLVIPATSHTVRNVVSTLNASSSLFRGVWPRSAASITPPFSRNGCRKRGRGESLRTPPPKIINADELQSTSTNEGDSSTSGSTASEQTKRTESFNAASEDSKHASGRIHGEERAVVREFVLLGSSVLHPQAIRRISDSALRQAQERRESSSCSAVCGSTISDEGLFELDRDGLELACRLFEKGIRALYRIEGYLLAYPKRKTVLRDLYPQERKSAFQLEYRTSSPIVIEFECVEPRLADPPLTLEFFRIRNVTRQMEDLTHGGQKEHRHPKNTDIEVIPCAGRTRVSALQKHLFLRGGQVFRWRPDAWRSILRCGIFEQAGASAILLSNGRVQVKLRLVESTKHRLTPGISADSSLRSWLGEVKYADNNLFGAGFGLSAACRNILWDARSSGCASKASFDIDLLDNVIALNKLDSTSYFSATAEKSIDGQPIVSREKSADSRAFGRTPVRMGTTRAAFQWTREIPLVVNEDQDAGARRVLRSHPVVDARAIFDVSVCRRALLFGIPTLPQHSAGWSSTVCGMDSNAGKAAARIVSNNGVSNATTGRVSDGSEDQRINCGNSFAGERGVTESQRGRTTAMPETQPWPWKRPRYSGNRELRELTLDAIVAHRDTCNLFLAHDVGKVTAGIHSRVQLHPSAFCGSSTYMTLRLRGSMGLFSAHTPVSISNAKEAMLKRLHISCHVDGRRLSSGGNACLRSLRHMEKEAPRNATEHQQQSARGNFRYCFHVLRGEALGMFERCRAFLSDLTFINAVKVIEKLSYHVPFFSEILSPPQNAAAMRSPHVLLPFISASADGAASIRLHSVLPRIVKAHNATGSSTSNPIRRAVNSTLAVFDWRNACLSTVIRCNVVVPPSTILKSFRRFSSRSIVLPVSATVVEHKNTTTTAKHLYSQSLDNALPPWELFTSTKDGHVRGSHRFIRDGGKHFLLTNICCDVSIPVVARRKLSREESTVALPLCEFLTFADATFAPHQPSAETRKVTKPLGATCGVALRVSSLTIGVAWNLKHLQDSCRFFVQLGKP